MAENGLERRRCSAWRGTAPATARTAPSGAANSCCSTARAHGASRTCGPSACPAASARCASRAALRSACWSRRSAQEAFDDAGPATGLNFEASELRVLRSMLARGTQRAAHLERRAAVRRRRGARRPAPGRKLRRTGGDGARVVDHGATPSWSWRRSRLPHAAPLILDWAPTLRSILDFIGEGAARGAVAAAFHRALAAAIAAVAARIGVRQVALSGGCFQNRHLLEWSVAALRAEGLEPSLAPPGAAQRRRHRARPGGVGRGGAGARAERMCLAVPGRIVSIAEATTR